MVTYILYSHLIGSSFSEQTERDHSLNCINESVQSRLSSDVVLLLLTPPVPEMFAGPRPHPSPHMAPPPSSSLSGPFTSQVMTSSPRAPPPPLTLVGATLGTEKKVQEARANQWDWERGGDPLRMAPPL